MKTYHNFIVILLLALSLSLEAAPVCHQSTIDEFKKSYVDLQNALRYEGKNIELKKGKVHATITPFNEAPGKAVEKALYNNYKNALIKVQKIYQKLNQTGGLSAEDQSVKDNPLVTEFFKGLDKSEPDKRSLNLNVKSLLENLDKVKVAGFELTNNDKYLLEHLVVHSQDRICTLSKYNPKNNAQKVQYLEQLKREPLNKMLDALKKMPGTDNLKLADQETTIDQAVKDALAKLKSIIKDHKECERFLKTPLNIGEKIQGCNYGKFIDSLLVEENKYSDFASILHFINANQLAANAKTSLDWINAQFKNESPTTCYVDPDSKKTYVVNLPFMEDKKRIDAKKFTCTDSAKKTITGEACVRGLNFELEDGLGYKLTARKGSNLTLVSINGSENCSNVPVEQQTAQNPVVLQQQQAKQTQKKEQRPEIQEPETKQPETKQPETKQPETRPPQQPTRPVEPPKVQEPRTDEIDITKLKLPYICSQVDCEKIKVEGYFTSWDSEKNHCKIFMIDKEDKAIPFCNEEGNVGPLTEDRCKAQDPKTRYNPTTKKCDVPAPQNDKECKERVAPNTRYIKEKKICEQIPNTPPMTDDQCKAKDPKKPRYDKDKKECFGDTEAASDEACKKKDPTKPFFNIEKKLCETTPSSNDQCKAKDPKTPVYNKEKNECVAGGPENDEQCKEKDANLPVYDKDKKTCVAVPSSKEEKKKAECDKKIEEDVDDNNTPLNNWSWDEKAQSCVNKNSKKGKEKDEEDAEKKEKVYPNKAAPQRFQPIQIPQRQIFNLNGSK